MVGIGPVICIPAISLLKVKEVRREKTIAQDGKKSATNNATRFDFMLLVNHVAPLELHVDEMCHLDWFRIQQNMPLKHAIKRFVHDL